MITKFEVKKYLGLDSWLALVIWLQEKYGVVGETFRIVLAAGGSIIVMPIKMPVHLGPDDLVWTVHMPQVKANAFDEVFSRLPTAESVQLIRELVGEIAQRAEVTGEHVHTFLNNIPTRTTCKF